MLSRLLRKGHSYTTGALKDPRLRGNCFFSKGKTANVSTKGDLRELFSLVKPERSRLIVGGVLIFLQGGIVMLFPQALAGLSSLSSLKYEKIEKEDEANPEELERKSNSNNEVRKKYMTFITQWVLIFACSGLLNYKRRFISGDVSNRLACRLRKRLYNNIIGREYGYFLRKDVNSAAFTHKLSTDIAMISTTLSLDMLMGVRSLFFVVGGSLYLMFKVPEWTFMSLGTMGCLVLLSRNNGKKVRAAKEEENIYLTKSTVLANEKLGNMKTVKICNTEEYEKLMYQDSLHKFYQKSRIATYYQSLGMGLIDGFGQISAIMILVYGSYLVSNGIGSPEILASGLYALYVGIGFRHLTNLYSELKKVSGLYQGISDVVGDLKEDPEYNSPNLELDPSEDLKKLNGSINREKHMEKPPTIEFKDITFKFDQANNALFENTSFVLEPGKILGLVGQSGSGKSTLLNLITKLFKPNSGSILINGQDLASLDNEWVQENVAYVPQEPIIFMGTVYENIIYGNQGFDTSMENVIKAAKIAGAHKFIEQLPEGYNSELTEKGQSLSGGQRQRIIIARAILKDPTIMLLDEATSSLDEETEKQIVKEMKEICKNRTCIIVSHRMKNFEELIDQQLYGGTLISIQIFFFGPAQKMFEVDSSLMNQIKYYNDLAWWGFSIITLIPLGAMVFYKLFFPVAYRDDYSDKNPFPVLKQDKILFFFLFWGYIYYVVDTLVYILKGDVFTNVCKMGYFIHHIMSITFLPYVILNKHRPWWLIAPAFMHAFLLIFPLETWLNYIYLGIVFFYHYGFYTEPWTRFHWVKMLKIGQVGFYVSLVWIWAAGCKNTFED